VKPSYSVQILISEVLALLGPNKVTAVSLMFQSLKKLTNDV